MINEEEPYIPQDIRMARSFKKMLDEMTWTQKIKEGFVAIPYSIKELMRGDIEHFFISINFGWYCEYILSYTYEGRRSYKRLGNF